MIDYQQKIKKIIQLICLINQIKMNKNLFQGIRKIIRNQAFPSLNTTHILKQGFCSANNEKISRRFSYGQGGQFTFDLTKRTYSLSFETIWQDYAELEYSGLTGQSSFFLTENGKDVKMDDIDLSLKQNEYIKIHSKIPEDYTIRGKINGSIYHHKNSVSSKTRSNPFEIQIIGYKNTYQWLNLECQDVKITNKNGQVNYGSLTTKNATVFCEDFKAKKVLFSGQFILKASHKAQIRSIVAFQDSESKIQDSNNVYIESLSGKLKTKNIRLLKIDRILSCKDGFQIQCDKINDHIIIQSGSGTIQCLKQTRQVLREKIKLGRMHKGKIDFDIYDNPNSPFSKVLIVV